LPCGKQWHTNFPISGEFPGRRTDIEILEKILQVAGMARLVIPGLPHHGTQRANHRRRTFFGEGDEAAYVELMEPGARWFGCRSCRLALEQRA
jgi:hypothetical protein